MLRLVPLLLLTSLAPYAFGQALPADPIKSLDGDWYGKTAKMKINVVDGVVTVIEMTSTDPNFKVHPVSVGTVLARFTGQMSPDQPPPSTRTAHLAGTCYQYVYPKIDLYPCVRYQAMLSTTLLGHQNRWIPQLTLPFQSFARRDDFAIGEFAARK